VLFWFCWSGWWLSHPSEKYKSQLGLLFPKYGKCSKPPTSDVCCFTIWFGSITMADLKINNIDSYCLICLLIKTLMRFHSTL
jgi:hypothetical protein